MSSDTPAVHLDAAQLNEIYDFALSVGRNAGKILLDGVEKRCGEESGRWQGQEDKESAVDIVTQTDLGATKACAIPLGPRETDSLVDVEAFVKSAINSRYPSHA